MNLNNQPTINEMAELFASQKDSHDSHILWVCDSGKVHIDCLSPCAAEGDFSQKHPQMRARLKMYRRGHGYVGKKAAADKDFIGRVLQTLQREWPAARDQSGIRVIDSYC